MKLSISDRVGIQRILPSRGNMVQQIIIRDIGKKIEFSQAEAKRIKMRVRRDGNTSSVEWDTAKAKDKVIVFTDAEIEIMKTGVEELDTKKQVSQALLPLCEKIRSYSTAGRTMATRRSGTKKKPTNK